MANLSSALPPYDGTAEGGALRSSSSTSLELQASRTCCAPRSAPICPSAKFPDHWVRALNDTHPSIASPS